MILYNKKRRMRAIIKHIRRILLLLAVLQLFSCDNRTITKLVDAAPDSINEKREKKTPPSSPKCVIYLQPYDDFSKREAETLLPILQDVFDTWLNGSWDFKISQPKALSQNSYLKKRNRYRALSVLDSQSKLLKDTKVIIGLTHKDICTNIHGVNDYGIIGISRPFKQVCIVSDKRLKDKSIIWKPILHEFMHTFYGAKHCPNDDPKCFMKDAKGHGNFEIQDKLCVLCKR